MKPAPIKTKKIKNSRMNVLFLSHIMSSFVCIKNPQNEYP
jgi:hypothetical protein